MLVPRPDSEVLIASAIEHFEGTAGPRRILDLGTGPGTLLLAALDIWPDATGLGVDVSRQALVLCVGQCAPARLRSAGRSSGSGNWAAGLVEKFDLILCNPPYVAEGAELGPGVREFEPDEALFAGERASTPIATLAPQLPRLLNQGGLAAVEIGHDQAEAVTGAARPRRAPARGSPTTSPDRPARRSA